MYDADGYLGFTFAGHHSSEYGLLVVSDGNRYHQNLSSTFNDTVITVPGKSGGYFFGTQIGNRDFEINCAFDDITTYMRNKIQQWLYPNKVGWLIFDEMPYKKYLVKISQPINFSYLPFNNSNINKGYYFDKDILKGELNISFFSFEEYAIGNEDYEIPEISTDVIVTQQMVDSGLIPSNYNAESILFSNETIKNFSSSNYVTNGFFNIYNAGNGVAKANFYFTVNKENLRDGIQFNNLDDGQSYIIKNFSEHENLKNYDKYRVEILGDKQEICAYGIADGIINKESKTNIGGYYNQYYPKIYHKKPTEVLLVTQGVDSDNNSDPLFYPAIYTNMNYLPSDSVNKNYSFEEFLYKWSDYTVCSTRGVQKINDVLNPAILFINSDGDNYKLKENSLIYLIYPNQFELKGIIQDFTPVFENTYI